MTAYTIDDASGALTPLQTISTLPAGYSGMNTCSQIHITASGKFLFAPNRGHNSDASFLVDPTTGRITAAGRVSTEPVPRAFGVDPDGRYLYSAGQQSSRLASYRIDQMSGELTALETYEIGRNPLWGLITHLGRL